MEFFFLLLVLLKKESVLFGREGQETKKRLIVKTNKDI